MTATTSEAAPTAAERARVRLLDRYGILASDDNRATLAAYVSRTHRLRWWGVVGAIVAAGVGLWGSSGSSFEVGVARLLAGYLAGSAAAELLSPQRQAIGAVHTASLASREPRQLLPAWARVLPWLLLLPCIASPLLLLGDHPVSLSHFRDRFGSVHLEATWYPAGPLFTIAVTACVALVMWRCTLHRLSRRRLPVDDAGQARLDLLMRALSARAVSGAAAALGMCLLGGIAYLGVDPLMSRVCTSSRSCSYVYAWHDHYSTLENVGGFMFAGAVLLFWFGRLARVDPALLRTAAGVAP